MASTYSTNLRLELMGTGDQSGTWGNTTNTNLGTLVEQAISGVAAVSMTSDADYTLTTANGATDQARQAVLNITSTVSLTATRNVIAPTVNKAYIVKNGTTGSQSLVIKTASGTGITVPNGSTTLVYCDGTNIVSAASYFPTLTIATALGIASGGTGLSALGTGVQTALGQNVTGSGGIVLATSPTLVTPILGVATATSVNKIAVTAPATGATLTLADNSTFTTSGAFSTTLTFTGTTSLTFPTSGTVTALGNTTTGSGSIVLATSPTLTTPTLGVASATSVNKLAITAPATGSTLTITDGKTLSVSNTLTLAGTDSTTVTFPGTSDTLAGLAATQTFTATNTFRQINYTNNPVSVSSNAGTVPVTHRLNTFTNSSAAAMTITMATAGAVDGQMSIVRIYDAAGAAQTINWVNTQNSTVFVPSPSNGSTTLPLTVGFMYNAASGLWRCVASS
jgi:hypothetical protein